MSIEFDIFSIASGNNNGWDVYVKNDWTDFAEKNGLALAHQKIKPSFHKKSPIRHTRGLSSSLPIEKFVESSVTEWFDKRALPSTDWTINRYKEIFKRKRPEWAKSFSERKIGRASVLQDRYKNKFIVPESIRTMNLWFVERELFIPDLNKKKKVVIERTYDVSNRCTNVCLIHLRNYGLPHEVRNEKRLSSCKWISSWWHDATGNLGIKKWPQLLKAPNPWNTYL